MRRLLCFLTLAVAGPWSPAGAEGRVRSLFVGIDTYAYTSRADHDPTFVNLSGPVNDVAMVEGALTKAYSLTFDPPVARCTGPAPDFSGARLTVTLLNECATRRNILAAFRSAIAASSPGDTVLFFFSGHGSHTKDDGDCAYARQDDTIVQYDARVDANDPESADIRGCELHAIIAGAKPEVRIVTIFDSCESGGATRGLGAPPLVASRARAAPAQPAAQVEPASPPKMLSPHAGYVHLAAARSGLVANETVIAGTGDGKVHGVFSYALKTALDRIAARETSEVTYADIFTQVGVTMTATPGAKGQQPWVEAGQAADLDGVFLGRPAMEGRVEAVTSLGDGTLTMVAGALSDVTPDSVWALYQHSADAGGDVRRFATARVSPGVAANSATLKADGPPPRKGALWAREIRHQFATPALKVWVDPSTPKAAKVAAALAQVDAIDVTADHPSFVFRGADESGAQLFLTDGDAGQTASTRIDADALDDEDYIGAVKAAAIKVARFVEEQSFGYRSTGTPPRIWIGAPAQAPDRFDDPPTVRLYQASVGDKFVTAVTNTAATPRYLYLLAFVDSTYDVAVMFPRAGSPTRMEAGSTVQVEAPGDSDNLCAPGRYDLLLLSSEKALDPSLFVQTGSARDVPDADASPLARLAAAAAAGSRRPTGPPVTSDWSSAMSTILVGPAADPPSGANACAAAAHG